MLNTTISHYRITEQLGAGGMGVVYRALDERLDRDVAIKVLPEEVARDPERLARFEREAKLLASLSHQNIAHLFGLETVEKTVGEGLTPSRETFLVMELAEGETLAARIERGPVPIEDALDWAKQIAEGLEAAHASGIIHRDLKPANVMLSPEGHIKILDFGLAKAWHPESRDVDIKESPTLTAGMTRTGTLLGTAAYMSPEQARGKAVDKRTDVWAFGCVLYEMLTGKRAFEGDDASQTMAAILRDDPDFDALPPATPAGIRRLLQRCLTKDPHDRLHDVADARIELAPSSLEGDSRIEATVSSQTGMRLNTAAIWALIATLASLAFFGFWPLTREQSRPAVIRSLVSVEPADWLGSDAGFGETYEPFRLWTQAMALSPDGGSLVFSGGIGTNSRLYVRRMEDVSAKPIPDTERGAGPFFSPDGDWIGFWAGGKVKKVRAEGGPTNVICAFPSRPCGATWGFEGSIYLGQLDGPIIRVMSDGGVPEEVTTLAGGEKGHGHPYLLPDGDTLLFTVVGQKELEWEETRIVAQSLATGETKILVENGAEPRYSPTGHLLFCRLGSIMAAPFDAKRLEVTGGAVVVIESIRQAVNAGHSDFNTFSAQYSVSTSGTLAHIPGGIWPDVDFSIVRVDLEGREDPLPVRPGPYWSVRVSPDGEKIVFTKADFGRVDVWVYEMARGIQERITHGESQEEYPFWTPDGSRITFTSDESGEEGIYWISADGRGSPERLIDVKNAMPASWSPDGLVLAFLRTGDGGYRDIWTLKPGGKPEPFIESPFPELWPSFSPDGRWLAYVGFDSGGPEVYVTPYPGPGPRHQISTNSGWSPSWAPDGRELYYLIPAYSEGTISMWAVDISMDPQVSAGIPRKLFTGEYQNFNPIRGYDVLPDGRGFLMLKRTPRPHVPVTHINLTLNWFEELERLVPTD